MEQTSTLHDEQFKDIIDKKLPQQKSIPHGTSPETSLEVKNYSSYPSRLSNNEENILTDSDSFLEILIKFGIEIKGKDPIGKGNFGAVYKGFKKEKSVAIKILHSNNDQATKELLKEVFLSVHFLQHILLLYQVMRQLFIFHSNTIII